MKKGLIDLHVHSEYSKEGITTTPKDIIDLALIKGVETLAITDHNTTMGCIDALEYIKKEPLLCEDLNFITGIEISCDTTSVMSFRDEDGHLRSSLAGGVHILGYGINPYHKGFLEMARFYADDTGKRTLALYKYIKRFYGITLDKDNLYNIVKETEVELQKKDDPPSNILNGVLVRALTTGRNAPLGRKNQYKNFYRSKIKKDEEIYEDFMFRLKKTFNAVNSELEEIAKQDILEMIALIEDAGGVAVIAHPMFYRPKRELAVADFEILSQFVDKVTGHYNEETGEFMRGVVGIELLHGSSFDDQFRFKFYDNLIKQKGLYITGGSDSHITKIEKNNLGYIRQNFSIKQLDFVDNFDDIIALGQKATSIKKQREREDAILHSPKIHENVDEQATLFNDYKKVRASEIIESQTISKKLLKFENEISASMFALKLKLYNNEDIDKHNHSKTPIALREGANRYRTYMLSIIDNKEVFFGNQDVFYDWLQHRLDFVNQASEELYELSVLDADQQRQNNNEVDNPHFTETRGTMKDISKKIEAEIAVYSVEKVQKDDLIRE